MTTRTRAVLTVAMVPAVFAVGLYGALAMRHVYHAAFPPPAYATGDHRALFERHGNPVVVYATATCPYCGQARALLSSLSVAYTELRIDESTDAEAEFRALGGRGVPLLFIGDRRIAGYRETVIREALAQIQPTEGVGPGLEQGPLSHR